MTLLLAINTTIGVKIKYIIENRIYKELRI